MALTVILSILSAVAIGELFVLAVFQAHAVSTAQARERFIHTQLRLVRRFYPELANLTYSEIVECYDVQTLYNRIGQHRSTLTTIKSRHSR